MNKSIVFIGSNREKITTNTNKLLDEKFNFQNSVLKLYKDSYSSSLGNQKFKVCLNLVLFNYSNFKDNFKTFYLKNITYNEK